MTLPFRPVSITFGKTVNNGWGGYECCWARTLIPCLVGALDVPGGTLGTTVRLNRPADNRWSSVKPGPDGFMDYPMNPTGQDDWMSQPTARSAHRTPVPPVANSAWSQALGPTHLARLMQTEDFDKLPHAPDVWLVYRTNPAISFWDTKAVGETMAKFPFTVCFALTRDETNHVADVLLPDCTDLEGLQLLRIGGTKYIEQFWDHQGFALRDPAVPPQGEARDFSWIATGWRAEPACSKNTTCDQPRLPRSSSGAITTSRSTRQAHDVERSGTRVAGRRAPRLPMAPRRKGSTGSAPRFSSQAVLATDVVPLPEAVRTGPALRAALPGAAAARRPRA